MIDYLAPVREQPGAPGAPGTGAPSSDVPGRMLWEWAGAPKAEAPTGGGREEPLPAMLTPTVAPGPPQHTLAGPVPLHACPLWLPSLTPTAGAAPQHSRALPVSPARGDGGCGQGCLQQVAPCSGSKTHRWGPSHCRAVLWGTGV